MIEPPEPRKRSKRRAARTPNLLLARHFSRKAAAMPRIASGPRRAVSTPPIAVPCTT